MLVCYVVNWDTMISVSKIIIIAVLIKFNIITGAVAIGRSNFNNRIVYRYYCSGNEALLQLCPKSAQNNYADNWYNRPRAAVECQQMSINLTSKLCIVSAYA